MKGGAVMLEGLRPEDEQKLWNAIGTLQRGDARLITLEFGGKPYRHSVTLQLAAERGSVADELTAAAVLRTTLKHSLFRPKTDEALFDLYMPIDTLYEFLADMVIYRLYE
jgi:hypothetical protein